MKEFNDPFLHFEQWFKEASNCPEIKYADAMCLSTATIDNQPQGRMVLLKQITDSGFCFFTNIYSNKGKSLKENPKAALTFYWDPLEKQVRIEGDVKILSEKNADEYFSTRLRGSQIGAWASRQSETLDSRASLEKSFTEFEEKYKNTDVPRPDCWKGYIVMPKKLDFMILKQFRLHDRLEYTLEAGGSWSKRLLYP